MTIQSSNDLGLKLCKILGINPVAIRKITIEVFPNEVSTVTIERHVLGGEERAIAEEIEKFELRKQ